MGEFVVGLDLGQAGDYTAIAVVEKVGQFETEQQTVREGAITYTKPVQVELPPHLYCRQLARADIGTKYPQIVRNTTAMLAMPELEGATLVVDGTGVGRAVIDMFLEAGLKPKAVHVTSGTNSHFENGYWRVPKKDLVAAAVAPLQDKRLLFTATSPLNEILAKEMMNFKIKITEAANETFGAWRSGENDDLIFAVMLACWWAQRTVKRNAVPASAGSYSYKLLGTSAKGAR
jgi:hypothetical protein